MADTKETKKAWSNFPRGNLEEMLRMMRKCRENGNIDCEEMMKKFMGKEYKNIDFNKLKKRFFDNGPKDFNLKEILKNCRKR